MIQGIDLCSIVQGRKCKLGEDRGIKQKKKKWHTLNTESKNCSYSTKQFSMIFLCVFHDNCV